MITISSRIKSGQSSRLRYPRLLVSVRSPAEAILALEGGAEILDVKEPRHGSLGMASVGVIEEIAGLVRQRNSNSDIAGNSFPPLSVALGELDEWMPEREIPSLPAEVSFAKLGLSNLVGRSEWVSDWQRIRERFDQPREVPIKWVAVAYADNAAAHSPPLNDVLAAAVTTCCAGLLIDTFAKTGKTLFDYVPAAMLKEIVERCHESGMFLAIAGRLTIEALEKLRDVPVDIVAIRSAACLNGNRSDAIDASLVAGFRTEMRKVTREN